MTRARGGPPARTRRRVPGRVRVARALTQRERFERFVPRRPIELGLGAGVGHGATERAVGFGEGGRGGVGAVDARLHGDARDRLAGDRDAVGAEINVRLCSFRHRGEAQIGGVFVVN